MIINEAPEPNNEIAESTSIPLGFGDKLDPDVELMSSLEIPFDVDIFKFAGERGDLFGVAVIDREESGKFVNGFDPQVTILDATGKQIFFNDNHGGIGNYLPARSQMLEGQYSEDSVAVLILPETGDYYVQISAYGAGSGNYFSRFRLRHPAMWDELNGSSQVVYLQFGGVDLTRGNEIFGEGAKKVTHLSSLVTFLPNWGLEAGDESDVIDGITKAFESGIQELLATDPDDGSGCVVRNSKDHKDFEADDTVSQIVIGGTIAELGIKTIGLSSAIDPGNFSRTDKAVVLLDLLSSPKGNPNSLNSLKFSSDEGSPPISFEETPREVRIATIASAISRIALHEAGHFWGCFHCRNDNDISCIMDRGGNLGNIMGSGPDKIIGTKDDSTSLFVADLFSPDEMFAEAGQQFVSDMVIAALQKGRRSPEEILRMAELQSAREALMAVGHRDALQEALMASKTPNGFHVVVNDDGSQMRIPFVLNTASANSNQIAYHTLSNATRRKQIPWWLSIANQMYGNDDPAEPAFPYPGFPYEQLATRPDLNANPWWKQLPGEKTQSESDF